MIPIKDVIQMASDAGAELGAMEGIEFAIVMTPDQLFTMCHLIFEMGKAEELQALREQTPVAYIEYSDDKRQSWYLVYSKSKDRQQEPLYAAPKAQNAPEA